VGRLTQDEPVADESTKHDEAGSGQSEAELAEPEVHEPELAEHAVAEPELAEHEPVMHGAVEDEAPEDERAQDELPEGELAADQPVAHEPVSHEPAEDEAPEDELADDEPAEHDAVGAGPSEPELAEPEPAVPELAEHGEAQPELAEHAEGEPEVAEPVAQAPVQQAPTRDGPDQYEPGEDGPDEEGSDGYRPDEDLSPQSAQPQGAQPQGAPPEAGPPPAPASSSTPPIVVVRGASSTRPTLVERALSGPGQHRAGSSWREHVRVVPGGHGPGRPDMERRDRARVLLPIHGPRLIVVLGCTVGAGQSVTTLMLADVLATIRAEPVAALDLNPGQTSLTGLARTAPAGTARGLLGGSAPIVPGQRGRGHLDLIAHDSAPDGGPALADEEYARVLEVLTSRYPLTLTDPGASAVARVLSTADQLVLVAPASADASRAVAMTMEWLDGHGYGELCTGAITVINGVSKRSMAHVEQAELVVRGRCRAIVRVPWDDHLGAPPAEQGISDATADAESLFAQVRPQVQHAYTALAGVLVSALAIGGNKTAPPGPPASPDGAPQRWAAR
jgi:MinD-like ATPase involved in chromosome partitioning or flagellar assembly